MFETIKNSEYEWFLWLNGFHNPTMDFVMSWVTYRFTWIPLYIYIIYYIFKKISGIFWQNLLFVLISVGLADRITSGFMKPHFARFRPCHDPHIQNLVHLVGGCGGQYGFASSHAANCFALAVSFLILSKKSNVKSNNLTIFLFLWAIFVSYSRIYVGVHFPTDLIVGAMIGSILPIFIFQIQTFFKYKFIKN